MKLTVKEGSSNYGCTVVKINALLDIEGADKIKRVVVQGNNVIVSKDTPVGELMLYFVSGTKLSEDYCHKNNLYEDNTKNRDTTTKGYINSKSRVRAIKLRGVISDGFIMHMSSLLPFLEVGSIAGLKEGDYFTDINGHSLCEKYFVPARNGNVGGKAPKQLGTKVKDIIIQNQFRFHFETEHFVRNLNKFSQESEVIITRKLHGSSLILSNVLVNKALSFKEKVFKFFGGNVPTSEYGMVWSSGKPKSKLPKGVVSEHNEWNTPNPSFYGANIWERAYNEIGSKVEKGISIYAEIVGNSIQRDLFTYNQDYGIHVFRITSTNVDGNVYEFSWEQVKEYCKKYELTHVQEYFVGKVKEMVVNDDNLLDYLQRKYLNKSYPDCVYDEGIVIRLRATDELFKLKSPNFILQEDKSLQNDIQNIEDI